MDFAWALRAATLGLGFGGCFLVAPDAESVVSQHVASPLVSACSLFGVARFGCGAVFSPDTFSVFTIFGVCQGGKDALTNPKNR
jgi:hypothetical protein